MILIVRVPSRLESRIGQHLLVANEKTRRVLGWRSGDPACSVPESVRWHLHRPATSSTDFDADDRALAEK